MIANKLEYGVPVSCQKLLSAPIISLQIGISTHFETLGLSHTPHVR